MTVSGMVLYPQLWGIFSIFLLIYTGNENFDNFLPNMLDDPQVLVWIW